MVRLEDDAGFGDDLMLDDVAVDTAVAELEVAAGAVDFLLNALWNDGQGDELGVGVLEGSTRALAMVLEDEHVAEAGVAGEVVDTIAHGEEQIGDANVRHAGEGVGVLGTFDDDLVGSDAVHVVVEAFRPAVDFTFDAEGWELVGNGAKSPAGLIG